MKRLLILSLLASITAAHADPQLTSWFTANSGKYARIYTSTANETAGTTSVSASSSSPWSRGSGTQTNPAYADVNEINYSSSWVYIRTTGLASHIMGPWYLDAAKTQNFPNFPSNTAVIYRIPRTPAIPGTKTLTGLGATGRMVNGVSMFDSRDAFSYKGTPNFTDATPTNGLTGDGIWNRDGYHNEGVTFDAALAHQAGNNYHYHAHPIGLRYQLGDHVDYNPTTNRYTESVAAPVQHSPIVAWAADGLPVYGPYGYSLPMNPASGVRRMVSGFTLRDGTNGTTAITVREVLPLWAQRIQNKTVLTAAQYGPAVSSTYLLGHYIEDFDYRGDLGQVQTTGATVMDFDLNEQNVRFCVTPEFPSGTWAYFTPINADGTPQYPYTTGRAYYGSPTGGARTEAQMLADTPLTQQFIGGANKALAIGTPGVAGNTVTLTWSAVEGGTYSVDASAVSNFSTFTNKASGLVSTDISKSTAYTALGTSGTEYGRVNRTALATYDAAGQTAATVAQSATTSYSLTPNNPPTITSISNQTTVRNAATSALSFTIGDTETAAASLTVTASSSNTTLVPNANIVITGTGASRSVTVTPALGKSGTATITITVNDGTTTTSTTFTLTVPRPNVLLIIADDFGLDASAVYNTSPGAQLAPTPNIASLAANGLKFTTAYSYTVCSPARSSILTGRYGFRTGTANVNGGADSNNSLKASEFTLPDAFAANSSLDYQLKHIGKWHLGGGQTAPCQIGGWPSFAGALLGEVTDFYSWTKVTASGAAPGSTTANSATSTTYATTDNVNDALAFISTQTAAGKPWFTWLAFNAPHTPYHKPPDSLHTYDTTVAGWASLPITGNELVHYNAAIEAMDTEIGRLLNDMDPAVRANTDIIFIGDNGTPNATLQTPYPANRGKMTLYEGGIRVPMIIRGPDVVSPGRTSAVLTHVVDLYSTILQLAGIDVAGTVPSGTVLDSQSLLPVLQNQAVTRTRTFDDYWDLAFPTLNNSGRVIRDAQYKLIRLKAGTDLFYDLTADPYESTNLIAGGVGAMTAPQQTAYNSLVTQLGSYNTAPTVSSIANQSIAPNTATSAIPFTIGDGELSTSIVSVTGASSNQTLVPSANVVIGGSDANRTVTVTPAAGQTGTSTITVSATDGIFTTDSSFLLTVAVSTPPTITSIATNPASPANTDTVTVTANVQPSSGRTLTNVQLTYIAGASSTSTVFSETMGTSPGAWTTANNLGTDNAWTLTQGPNNPYSQTTVANHTGAGAGHDYGMEINGGPPAPIGNVATVTTTNNINAATLGGNATTSAYVEFYMMSSNLSGSMGWEFQTSTDGATWTTQLGETTGSNHAYQLYHYDLTAGERASTLKLRFRFAGSGMNATVSKMSLDDIVVVASTVSTPVNVSMTGAVGGGTFTTATPIPAKAIGTTVSYTITATDSAAGATTSSTQSYTVVTASPALTVTPATGLTSSGNQGGAFSPSSATYTLTNTGTGSMNWTAGKSAAWLTLSPSSGTLAAGANASVTVSISATANTLGIGGYNDTVTFTNSTNAAGNTSRVVNLTVNSSTPPAAPVLVALPAFSQGTAKTVSWPAVVGATSYTFEVSATSNFSSVLASQTVTSPTASFSNLANGVTYYYRVKATNGIGSSGYSNVVSSTQDTGAPLVAITSPASGTSTASNTITVTGTSSDAVSGISKVTVNGVTASTSNNFANWNITVPLGFGTNGITAVAYDNAGNVTTTAPVLVTLTAAQTYNPLIIPEVMTGTTFDLNLHTATKQFLAGVATNTYAYNNMLFWGPTLIMNKGDWVQLNVTNNLADTTTTHWHGFHIPAIMDGGPHQTIPAGTTWRPSFKVDNNAGTYWYHPHLHEFTQQQLTRGGGGLIIIRDPEEAALTLPRTYGVDDIPLALTSRRFLTGGGNTNQFATTNSAYGDYMVVNGTMNPQVTLPRQYVRLRILNAEIERSYNLGFSDGRTFYQIATDGGLVNAPTPLTRLTLGVGERAEILVDLTGATEGSSLDLQAFNSGQAPDFPGGEPGTTGQFGSLLNNTTFNILHINIGPATANPVTTRPTTLKTNAFWTGTDVTNDRALQITGGLSGATDWSFDSLAFSPTVINQTLNLNAVERWTITNNSGFSHSFHIHDIQFYMTGRTGGSNTGLKAYEAGWKDTVFIGRLQTVTFIAKFDGFASNTNPFMYHCHFSNHEDEGLMGQFVVVNNAIEDLAIASFTRTGNNSLVRLDFKATPGTTYTLQHSPNMTTGSWTDVGSVTSDGTSATFIETDATRLGQARGFYRVTIPRIP
jgi:FtsP/CotA-like multicopper oxidase with cupredoxin domain/arylsulfatase A-like enzyme